jgi:ABC-type enterochelin transport system ATPase subunit
MGYFAGYYKCALQVNPYSYSRFRGKAVQNEEDYNQAILDRCVKNNIKIIGLADHGCVDSSESLREKLKRNDITVFPGFEITSAEKIHMVCLFPPEKSASDLNRFLGALGLEACVEGNETSTKTCLDIADQVIKLDGFWYAAHISSDNGILKLGKLNQIWKDKRLVAAQIPESKENIDPNYLNIIKNKEPQYKREHMLALINACDIEKPEDLEKETATTLIKMTEPSFENFVMAFKDPDSRIKLNSEIETAYQSCIKTISVYGGYLDGLCFDLSDNLTTIIGGRGTGKSTIINLVRYTLDLPIEKDQLKNFNSMIESNLGSSSRVEILVVSNAQFGKKFHITRRYKQSPVILDEQGNVSNLTISDILPTVEIYGQNEIIDVVNDPNKINRVVQRLISIDTELNKKQQESYDALVSNGAELTALEEEIETDNEAVSDLPAFQERIRFYNEAGLADKLSIIKKLATEEGQFDAFNKKIPKDSVPVSEVTIVDSENDELKLLAEAVKAFNGSIGKIKADYAKSVTDLKAAFDLQKNKWIEKKTQYDQEIKESLKQVEGIQDKSSAEIVEDYSSIIKRVESSEPIQSRIEKTKEKITVLLNARENLIENYRVCCDESDQKINKLLKRLNTKKLNGKLRLSIKYRQQKQQLVEVLKKLDGIGEKSLLGMIQYEDFDVFTFANDVRQGASLIKTNYALAQGIADKICTGLNAAELRKIEQLQLQDLILIELEVNGHFKKLENLSKGQQCTAILNILLLDNKDPLIVDQPEDNLDNAFIAANLVETIRANKIKRQYVFATHNANIPVFGDAELIVAMEELDRQGKISDNGIGSIDSVGVRNRVVQILEGGPEAFRMREKKYGIR